MELKAIAMIELNSIAKGVETADEMLKTADVDLIMAHPICAGKYMVLVSGDVDSVERAADIGKETAAEFLVDDFVIPNVHASVFPALTATTRIQDIDSLAVIETFSVASSIMAADAAVKAADVDIIEIRSATGLGGKSFLYLILKLINGAIVDVGGGTTGIAVIKNGKIDFTCDEATGGVHLSLVVAGNYKIDYEAAEKLKTDPDRRSEIVPVVRPVIEKIASIVKDSLQSFTDLSDVCLVGGTCELAGFAEIVQEVLQINTFRPEKPQFITPLGIALSCLEAD